MAFGISINKSKVTFQTISSMSAPDPALGEIESLNSKSELEWMILKKIPKLVGVTVIGIILNVVGRYIAYILNLPVWLDMVGTVISSYYGGLLSGIIAGLASNVVSSIYDVSALVYSVINVAAAILIHIFIKKGYLNNVLKAVISIFWLGVLCTIMSTPLNIIFYDGYSGNIWGDTLIDMLKWHDVSDFLAALAGEAVVEIVDKQISVLLACLIIYFISCLKKAKQPAVRMIPLILTACIISAAAMQPIESAAVSENADSDNFVEKIYNNTNGMVASEANVICETEDGYIWIGSYAGLTGYNGAEFEFIREGGLVNVVSMMTDSKGRLWIGTNDAGIARYENGEYTYFTVDDGLPSNSVRCFAEDKDGNVYVGTSGKICRFSIDDTIEVSEHDITFATSMAVCDDKLFVIDNNGSFSALDGEKLLTPTEEDKEKYFFYSLASTSEGLLIGTESGELFSAEVSEGNIKLREKKAISADKISAMFEDSRSRIWLASGSEFGYIAPDGSYHKMSIEGYSGSINCFHEDYQGNIWVASTNYGVIKLSESRFANAFDNIGAEKQVVNAVAKYRGSYFCGTDNGLVIFKENGFSDEFAELSELTDGCRVRSIYADSKDGLWICTYSGLIYYSSNGEVRRYDTETDSVTSDRFRCITELSDGAFAAGTSDGINFFRNGELTGTLTAADGMENTQILSITEGNDGTIWAGSDGSGIYVIADGGIKEKYTVENGLPSNIILRIVPCGNKYLIVTSNSLCCIDEDGKVRKLESFPYFNNYDIMLCGEKAYITCSAGLYEIGLNDLCDDNCDQIRLYNAGDGLFSGLTANSWNYISENEELYLCSNNGVIIFNPKTESSEANMKFGIASLECDEQDIKATAENTFSIPADAKNISIYASVRNYSFSDAKVRFYVKEFDSEPKLYSWNEIEPIKIYKPDAPEYHICMQLLDSAGEKVLQEIVYTVSTEPKPWDTPIFKTYLIVACTEVVLSMLISIVIIIFFVIRKNELEKIRRELEDKVSRQTGKLMTQQKEIKDLYIQTVTALSEAVDAKDRYTSGHSKRVAEYSRMLAAKMGKTKEEQEEIYRAGLLHDIGKIRIPVEIINKASKLTDEEYNIIKIHPVTGYHILRGISGSNLIAISAKYHHERYDGKGYPNGLVGDKIPEVARILGVADAYDAMTSNRSYRNALPQDVVRCEIEKGRGTQFDPHIADIMLEMIDEDKDYKMKQADFQHRRILTVDDEPINNMIIANIMKDEPAYEIVSVCSGEEALDILERQTFNLIFLDVRMPGMDGLETLKAIREKYNTPVVLMTGDKELETAGAFAELGCDDFITKPFLPMLIKEEIHNMTERMTIKS